MTSFENEIAHADAAHGRPYMIRFDSISQLPDAVSKLLGVPLIHPIKKMDTNDLVQRYVRAMSLMTGLKPEVFDVRNDLLSSSEPTKLEGLLGSDNVLGGRAYIGGDYPMAISNSHGTFQPMKYTSGNVYDMLLPLKEALGQMGDIAQYYPASGKGALSRFPDQAAAMNYVKSIIDSAEIIGGALENMGIKDPHIESMIVPRSIGGPSYLGVSDDPQEGMTFLNGQQQADDSAYTVLMSRMGKDENGRDVPQLGVGFVPKGVSRPRNHEVKLHGPKAAVDNYTLGPNESLFNDYIIKEIGEDNLMDLRDDVAFNSYYNYNNVDNMSSWPYLHFRTPFNFNLTQGHYTTRGKRKDPNDVWLDEMLAFNGENEHIYDSSGVEGQDWSKGEDKSISRRKIPDAYENVSYTSGNAAMGRQIGKDNLNKIKRIDEQSTKVMQDLLADSRQRLSQRY